MGYAQILLVNPDLETAALYQKALAAPNGLLVNDMSLAMASVNEH